MIGYNIIKEYRQLIMYDAPPASSKKTNEAGDKHATKLEPTNESHEGRFINAITTIHVLKVSDSET